MVFIYPNLSGIVVYDSVDMDGDSYPAIGIPKSEFIDGIIIDATDNNVVYAEVETRRIFVKKWDSGEITRTHFRIRKDWESLSQKELIRYCMRVSAVIAV